MSAAGRLDKELCDRGLAETRQKAQALILAGVVYVDGQKADKAGRQVKAGAAIEVRGEKMPFVSRGGLKLAGALDELHIDPSGLTCLDVGQSSGGFTDCLLQRGAARVIGVDVGYGQVALSIRNDPRVTVIERANFRYFDPSALSVLADLAVIDVSFISLKLILPVACKCCRVGGRILALVKPQFEVGKGQVGSGGVVRDDALREEAVRGVVEFAREKLCLDPEGRAESLVQGPKGNIETFCLFVKKEADFSVSGL